MPYSCAYLPGGNTLGQNQTATTQIPYNQRQGNWPLAPAALADLDQPETVLHAAQYHSLVSGWPTGLLLAQLANENSWYWPPLYQSSYTYANNPFNLTVSAGLCSSSPQGGGPVDFVSLLDGILAAALITHKYYNGRDSSFQYLSTTAGAYPVNLNPNGSSGNSVVNIPGAFRNGILLPAGDYVYESPSGSTGTVALPHPLKILGIAAPGGNAQSALQAACIALGASPWAASHYLEPSYSYPGSSLWEGILHPSWPAWSARTDLTAVTDR